MSPHRSGRRHLRAAYRRPSRSTTSSVCSTRQEPRRPTRRPRPRAARAVVRNRGPHLRGRGLDVDDVDLDDGVARLWGKGQQRWSRSGRTPWRPSRRTSSERGRCWPPEALVRRHPRCSSTRVGDASAGRAWAVLRSAASRRSHRRGVAAHPAALLRDPSARRRRRCARRAGAARSRVGDDHADLHPRDRRPAARGVRRGSPSGPLK